MKILGAITGASKTKREQKKKVWTREGGGVHWGERGDRDPFCRILEVGMEFVPARSFIFWMGT